jgi:DNA recombination protein RmuC
MIEILTLVLLVIFAGVVGYLLLRPEKKADGSGSMLLIQQQIDALRNDTSQSLQFTADTVSRTLKDTTDIVFQSLRTSTDQMNQQIGVMTKTMQNVSEQLNQQMSTQTSTIGSRLDNAAKVIGELQHSQGQILKAGDEIKQLGQSMSKLEELLKAPKLRGGLGELLLEDLLRQILPQNSFATQYRFRNGNTVDAVIKTANGMISIDSKFPLENFRKMIEAQTEQEKKSFYKLFVSDVKKHIDAISQKYIVPDENTFDFALMYIPAENIYYETIIKNDLYGDENVLYNYAVSKRVFSVSPNTFYPQLQIIALGFKGMEVEKGAKEIIQNLTRLHGDLTKFAEEFELLGKHLTNASNKYGETARKLDKFEEKLHQASGQALPPAGQNELPL